MKELIYAIVLESSYIEAINSARLPLGVYKKAFLGGRYLTEEQARVVYRLNKIGGTYNSYEKFHRGGI